MQTSENFHSQEYFEKIIINATYVVALIPKMDGARDLKDFR